MAPLIQALLLTSSLLSLTTANTVKFDIQKNQAVQSRQLRARSEINLQRRSIARRAKSVTATLTNAEFQGLYFANVTVGTPPQKFALQIDTGSSDVWVPSSSATFCGDVKEGGCPDGTFASAKSSTFQDIGQGEFNISYVDGTGSTGDYFLDTFGIGGATLTNFQMGLALDTTIGTGIMGIGYESSEASLGTTGQEYTNLPVAMVNQSLINSVAYSLWLNDLNSNSGSVLFGGIDTKKYTGDLVSIDVYPTSRAEGITSFTVAWTSLSATSSSGTDQLTPSDFASPAILDSGTTITLLPDELARSIFEELGAEESEQLGVVVVPCALAKNTGTLNYGFGGVGGPVIKVAMSELVLPLTDANGDSPHYNNGQTACQLGIEAAGEDPVLFGDTFLRSAYVVYDLINNRIALASTNFNAADSNIVEFASSGAPIPSATSAPNEAAVTQTATGNPRAGGGATATGTAASVTYNPTATGLSAEAGFASNTATGSSGSSSTGKKSASGPGPEPFKWSGVWVGMISVALMGAGSGFFVLL